MEVVEVLKDFFKRIEQDSRITPVHISLFMALYQWYESHDGEHPLYFFSRDLKPLAKVSSTATFHKCLKELHEFKYIRYTPSYSPFLGSTVHFLSHSNSISDEQ